MNIRKLIREEVEKSLTCDHDPNALRRSIPFEYDIQLLQDTQHSSSFHLGGKPINAKEMGLESRVPEIKRYASSPKEKERETTEREKDYNAFMKNNKFGAGGAFVRSEVYDAPRMDAILYGSMMQNFNVNAMFEDANGDHVVRISLKGKNADADRAKHEEYIPGGLASRKSLKDISVHHDVPMDALLSQLKKGVKVEMEHTTDELIAIEIAKDHLMEDPIYYDKLETIEKPKFENSMGVSAYSKPNATILERQVAKELDNINKVFGTNYFVETTFPEQSEDTFIIRSGKVHEDGSPVVQGGLVNFTGSSQESPRASAVG